MNTTEEITRLDAALERCNNYARTLGHLRGSVKCAIISLEGMIKHGDGVMDSWDLMNLQRIVDTLKKDLETTKDAQAFGRS
jgi:hypothetical protein